MDGEGLLASALRQVPGRLLRMKFSSENPGHWALVVKYRLRNLGVSTKTQSLDRIPRGL